LHYQTTGTNLPEYIPQSDVTPQSNSKKGILALKNKRQNKNPKPYTKSLVTDLASVWFHNTSFSLTTFPSSTVTITYPINISPTQQFLKQVGINKRK